MQKIRILDKPLVVKLTTYFCIPNTLYNSGIEVILQRIVYVLLGCVLTDDI